MKRAVKKVAAKQPGDIRPHMSADEVALFTRFLDSARLYLEFGSGGTTVEAAARAHLRCFSVEADKKWITKLKARDDIRAAVAEDRLTLAHANIGPVGAWSMPVERKRHLAWENYCLSIWRRLPAPPDMVLVDGRFRLACCITVFLACPPDTAVLIHDFGVPGRNRKNYALAKKFADVTESCQTLAVLRRKSNFDPVKALAVLNRARKDYW